MIVLKTMAWSNWFSYGDNNKIDFNSNTLTQVIGTNGSGKSSIPLILEELLYGKNSKGVKKQDITNRYTGTTNRTASLEFDVATDSYKLDMRRTSTTTKLSLFKNGVDISSHTSTNTYKQLEQIIGIDFKTFTQLIYQSSKSSLEFLTSTDTQRKNFLIALLGLDKYSELHEIFKREYKEAARTVSEVEGSYKTIKQWIEKHTQEDLNKEKELDIVVEDCSNFEEELALYKHEQANIHKINKQRIQNNQYKKLLAQIDMYALSEIIEKPADIQNVISERDYLNKQIIDTTNKAKKLLSLKSAICPTCNQDIDFELQERIIGEWRIQVKENSIKVGELDEAIGQHREIEKKYQKHKDATEEFERLNMLIDKDMPELIISEAELKGKIEVLENKIKSIKNRLSEVEKHNRKIRDKNSRIDLILTQIDQYKNQLEVESSKLTNSQELMIIHDILRQSFSTNGLVSYKIEYLVKDLEQEINTYLSEFSSGRFQLAFTLKGEKLNIEIIDEGNSIDISALSSGELARVNISTLLAIRKLMSSISSTKINLLFLDEIMGVLDAYGKDKLIEVLLEESSLNTFLVSHEYTHPLLEKITIVKNGNISNIEHG